MSSYCNNPPATPTHTPVPASPTPEPTIPLGIDLILSSRYFSPNDIFNLTAELSNPGPETYEQIPLVILLEASGIFFWRPNWSENFDFELIDLDIGITSKLILEFTWPDTGASQMTGLMFCGAFLDEQMTEILGLFDCEMWEYGPS